MSETQSLDADTAALLASIERGLQQAASGEVCVATGAEIARRTRGRPKGSLAAVRKEAITLRLAPDVLAPARTGQAQTRPASSLLYLGALRRLVPAVNSCQFLRYVAAIFQESPHSLDALFMAQSRAERAKGQTR